MKLKAGAALVAACGEEGIEGLPLDIRRHAGAIVRKNDLDVIIGAQPRRDGNRAGSPVRKRVVGGVEKEISQNLSYERG